MGFLDALRRVFGREQRPAARRGPVSAHSGGHMTVPLPSRPSPGGYAAPPRPPSPPPGATVVHRPQPPPPVEPPVRPPATAHPAQERGAPQAPPPRPAADKTIYDGGAQAASEVVGVLVAISGPVAGEVYALRAGDNTLGRTRESRIVVADPRISALHAKIVHDSGDFVIESLKEQNPTRVNAEAISGREILNDGDVIAMGKTELKFRTV
jgi:hypothetical protein